MSSRPLQRGFSEAHPDAMFDAASRGRKARKAVAILQDHQPALGELDLLEIGCSAGYGSG